MPFSTYSIESRRYIHSNHCLDFELRVIERREPLHTCLSNAEHHIPLNPNPNSWHHDYFPRHIFSPNYYRDMVDEHRPVSRISSWPVCQGLAVELTCIVSLENITFALKVMNHLKLELDGTAESGTLDAAYKNHADCLGPLV